LKELNKMDFSTLTDEQLNNLWAEKQVAVEVANEELNQVAAAVKARLIEAEIVRKIGGITPEELEVLRNMAPAAQSMNTSSIESAESVAWNEK
jgi:hypothetical protein